MEYKVPIEIVLQDPSDPIVPDTSDTTGGGSSTSAPNTAVGEGGLTTVTKDSSSDGGLFGSLSASTSIVAGAAIIMILAISATIAILVRKHYKNKKFNKTDGECETIKTKATRKDSLVAAATSTLAIIAAVVMVSNLGIAATSAANEPTYLDVADKIQIVANRYEDVTIVATTKNISYATTSTTFGYKLFMSMAGDSANLYLDGDETSEYYFAPTTRTGLDLNSWGYNFDDEADYSAMPLADDALLIKQNTSAATDEEIDVYYTMKADKDMPYGIYKGEITYTIEGFNGFPASLTTMQGMTSAICDAVYTPSDTETVVPTITLTDTRDTKTYEVAKLADGHCWMVQNLDLDLSTETALVPTTSNVSNSWTPENSTITTGNLSSTTWPSNEQANYDPYSYDPGDVFYYSSGTTSGDTQYTSLEDCQAEHPDCSMKNHAGNYYSWSAAVASNDTSESTTRYTNMEDSICPAGWELPNGPQNSADQFENNDFNTLFSAYDGTIIGSRPNSCGGLCPYYNYADGGFNAIRTAPLWLARSGNVYGGSLVSTTYSGLYWSSTVYSSSNAYDLDFYSGGVYPTNEYSRYGGYSIRCLAQ